MSLLWVAPWAVVTFWFGGLPAALLLTGAALTLLLVWKVMLERDIERIGVPVLPPEIPQGTDGASAGEPSGWSSLPDELGRSLVRLVQGHARMEAILAAIHDGVIALNADGRVTLLNQRARELLALPSVEVVGQSFAPLCSVPELVEFSKRALADARATECQILQTGRSWQVYASPVQSTTRLVLVVRDVTEVRRLETLRRDFVANVSHELKTPLSSIQAYVDTLLDGAPEDPEAQRTFIQRIARNVGRLSALITDLLTISRVESGKAVSQRYRLDIRTVLDECAPAWESRAQEKDIRLEMIQDEQPLRVLAEAEALRQVFNNLVGNAITYTEPAGAIRVVAECVDEGVRVRIEDTGIGIPMGDLPRIFERFYRVDKARSRNSGGTGLGLAIVKHYVEALQGRLHVESDVGKGSVFSVTFPAAPERRRS